MWFHPDISASFIHRIQGVSQFCGTSEQSLSLRQESPKRQNTHLHVTLCDGWQQRPELWFRRLNGREQQRFRQFYLVIKTAHISKCLCKRMTSNINKNKQTGRISSLTRDLRFFKSDVGRINTESSRKN